MTRGVLAARDGAGAEVTLRGAPTRESGARDVVLLAAQQAAERNKAERRDMEHKETAELLSASGARLDVMFAKAAETAGRGRRKR